MNEEIEKLQAKFYAARDALQLAEKKQQETDNRALVGRHFKYRNSYSGSRQWWMYTKVLAVRGSKLMCHEFQTTCDGKIEINLKRTYFGRINGSYQKATAAEFKKAWRAVQKKIAAQSV